MEEEIDQMQTYDICKEKSNTVEIRQSDDLRCDKCVENPIEKCVENPIEKPRDRETSVTEKKTKLQL